MKKIIPLFLLVIGLSGCTAVSIKSAIGGVMEGNIQSGLKEMGL